MSRIKLSFDVPIICVTLPGISIASGLQTLALVCGADIYMKMMSGEIDSHVHRHDLGSHSKM